MFCARQYASGLDFYVYSCPVGTPFAKVLASLFPAIAIETPNTRDIKKLVVIFIIVIAFIKIFRYETIDYICVH